MNYYEHHLGDWAAATSHLTWDEDMAYTRLLRAYYHAERAIPEGQQYRLAKAGTPAQRKAVDSVLAEFFTLEDGAYRQKRADAEIARYQDKQRKAKASANARWSAPERNADAMRTHSEKDANALRAQCEGNAHQTPDTRHQTKKQDQELPAAAASGSSLASDDQPACAQVIAHPSAADRVPYQQIVDVYHEILPMLPRVIALTNKRKDQIRARWKSGELPDIDTWRAFFADVKKSDFLCGRATPAPGRRVFFADIEFLTNQSNFVKFQEGRYDSGVRHG